MEIGTAADWVGAAVAAAAFLAAAFAGWASFDMNRLEKRREGTRQRESTDRQARRVSAWHAVMGDEKSKEFGVVVRNGSDEVVYDVVVSALERIGHHGVARTIEHRLSVLPPGLYFISERSFAVAIDPHSDRVRALTAARDRCIESISFTDAQDQRWDRNRSSPLRKSPQ